MPQGLYTHHAVKTISWKMIRAVISDIHANWEALETVLIDARRHGAERLGCLGDVIGYGPDAPRCVESMQEFEDADTLDRVIGNHDRAALVCGILYKISNKIARETFDLHKGQLNSRQRAYVVSAPYKLQQGHIIYVHATLNEPDHFRYPVNREPNEKKNETHIEETFALMTDGQVCFSGHTHRPKILIKHNGHIYEHPIERPFEAPADGKTFVCVGSVGQPRTEGEKDIRACYAIYDDRTRTGQLHKVEYDAERTVEKIMQMDIDKRARNALRNTLLQL